MISPLFRLSIPNRMRREAMLEEVKGSTVPWDIAVIGGGAAGLGTAVDAASRGYRTLLLEQGDFAQGTSSRSTKLIHGGIRYLRQGRLGLVRKALQERVLLLQNAPHLVHPLSFVLPARNLAHLGYLWAGVKLYDLMAGHLNLAPSRLMSKEEMSSYCPSAAGGICFTDAQFDDARLAIHLAQTAAEQGGALLNYMRVTQLLKEKGRLVGLIAQDQEDKREYEIFAKVIVNATGASTESIRRMDEAGAPLTVVLSQGSHLVLDRILFPLDKALVVPWTPDDRLLFIIPWYHRVLVGTTEILCQENPPDPRPSQKEMDYLLTNASPYLTRPASSSDILSAFAGIRALVKPTRWWKSSARLSRDHRILVSDSQLISIIGGKWTTYRKIAEDVVDIAGQVGRLPSRLSKTQSLPVHGSDEPKIEALASEDPSLLERLHADLPCRGVDVIWAVRHEMARTVEDVLSRRTRCTSLGAAASREIAPRVAALMAQERKHGQRA